MTVGLNRADGRVCVRESHHHAMGVPVNHLIVDPRLHDDGDGLACELHPVPYYDEDGLVLYQADVLDGLAALPADSVDCVVTSPPYWSLRSYAGEQDRVWDGTDGCAHAWTADPRTGEGYGGTARWQHDWVSRQTTPAAWVKVGRNDNGRNFTGGGGNYQEGGPAGQMIPAGAYCVCGAWRGSYGLEPTHTMYVAHTVEVMRAIRRVLKPTGVVWLNLGDSYASVASGNRKHTMNWTTGGSPAPTGDTVATGTREFVGLKPKDMCLIPQRVAIALQEDGWYVRCDVIWAKPNPMPESVTDRPTKAHEYIWLLSKSAKYWWDADAVREAQSEGTFARYGKDNRIPANDKWAGESRASMSDYLRTRDGDVKAILPNGRNIRSVWTMPTQPSPLPHFAMFPEALAARCIKAGTSEKGCCAACGAPWARVSERTAMVVDRSERTHEKGRTRTSGTMLEAPTSVTTGWRPTCDHGGDPVPCVVLDPFAGMCTTLKVARDLGRRAIGIELSAEYAQKAVERLRYGIRGAVAIGNGQGVL